jgi:hypothetical protein
MARKTEQEIHRTLEFLNDTDSIDFDPSFVDRVCSRTVGIPGRGGLKHRGILSSAVVIVILLILNLATSLMLIENRKPSTEQTIGKENYAIIMAGEYFSDQDAALAF